MKLGCKNVGQDQPPFCIAEMSGNHNQSLDRALEIVDAAAWAGADALKIQTYKPETMTLNLTTREFFISDDKSLWKGKSLYELYGEAMTPWDWHAPIKKRCEEQGMEFFSTPFDHTAVRFLEELNVKFYKVASFENIDLELLKSIASTQKPVIISTGLASLEELTLSIQTLRDHGAKDLIMLKCTSAYPAPVEQANLQTMANMKEVFNCPVGVSDHTLGNVVPITSVVLGGCVIEKHFTLKRSDGGVDSAFSLEPSEFKSMKDAVTSAYKAMGSVFYGVSDSEKKSLVFRRSLYFSKSLKRGDLITAENMRSIRPGYGLNPRYYQELLGRQVNRDIEIGTPVSWNLIT